MAWGLIKETSAAVTGTTSPQTIVFKGGNQPQNLLVIGISAYGTGSVSVTDGTGDVFTQVAGTPNAGGTQFQFWAQSIGSNADNPVTITFTGFTRVEAAGVEYAGQQVGNPVNAIASQFSGTASLAYTLNNAAGELIVSINGRAAGGGAWSNLTTGAVERLQSPMQGEYNDIIQTGPVTNITATGPGTNVAGLSVSYKPALQPSILYNTGQAVINAAARKAGFLGSGDTLQGNDPLDILNILRQMMDEWQAEGLRVFSENINIFPLTIGVQSYQLGQNVAAPGFNMPRPAKINRMGIQILSNPTQPTEVPISVLDWNGWANIRSKSIQSSYAMNCYPDYDVPIMNLQFWCIPALAQNVVIYSEALIPSWNDLSFTSLTFPPAYAKAITCNLALEICGEYHLPVDPVVVKMAADALEKLETMNLPQPISGVDPALINKGGAYDWRTDTFIIRRS